MAVAVADEHKGEDLLILDMRDVTLVADYFVLITGLNPIHVDTLADRLEERLAQAGVSLLHREGGRPAHWILLDYGDVVVHVFTPDERRYYDLERLWGDARVIERHGTG
jgi:ribosome-associated protein